MSEDIEEDLPGVLPRFFVNNIDTFLSGTLAQVSINVFCCYYVLICSILLYANLGMLWTKKTRSERRSRKRSLNPNHLYNPSWLAIELSALFLDPMPNHRLMSMLFWKYCLLSIHFLHWYCVGLLFTCMERSPSAVNSHFLPLLDLLNFLNAQLVDFDLILDRFNLGFLYLDSVDCKYLGPIKLLIPVN